jgi:hypothetical protein
VSDEHRDPFFQALAALPAVTPDRTHAERVRASCLAALTASGQSRTVVEPAVGAACAAYALQLARIAILLSR